MHFLQEDKMAPATDKQYVSDLNFNPRDKGGKPYFLAAGTPFSADIFGEETFNELVRQGHISEMSTEDEEAVAREQAAKKAAAEAAALEAEKAAPAPPTGIFAFDPAALTGADLAALELLYKSVADENELPALQFDSTEEAIDALSADFVPQQ